MAYSDFTLEKVRKSFGLTISEKVDLFSHIEPLEPSYALQEFLQENAPLALQINTEKARSEMIIAPILLDLRKQLQHKISLFSGVEFNVNPELGLNGVCDFLISGSIEQLFIEFPVAILVEAKKENIAAGLGQCGAEMVAAQVFNQREEKGNLPILGVVTSGNLWKFLQLEDKILKIDLNEYYLRDIGKVLGILATGVQ
jgi:hypothetical protein